MWLFCSSSFQKLKHSNFISDKILLWSENSLANTNSSTFIETLFPNIFFLFLCSLYTCKENMLCSYRYNVYIGKETLYTFLDRYNSAFLSLLVNDPSEIHFPTST